MAKSKKEEVNVKKLLDGATKPPAAVEIEKAVLGAMLIEPSSVAKVIEIVKPEYFYDKRHEQIYYSMTHLFNAGEPIDVVSVTKK